MTSGDPVLKTIPEMKLPPPLVTTFLSFTHRLADDPRDDPRITRIFAKKRIEHRMLDPRTAVPHD